MIVQDRAVLDVQRQRDERGGAGIQPPGSQTMGGADLLGSVGQFRGQGTQ